ncbi:MAG: 2TM domain-containing protein [Hyellaceae cyanobacterium CSU_1_1]|nr:2TM domain-containing protein [Hyellaceae cyanobacterium CSU_1_1]
MDFLKPPSTHAYSQEDVREILNIAMADRSTLDSELSHPQLLEIAQELSISPETIKLAKSQWLSQQQVIKKHQDFDLYRRSKLQDRFGKYAIVNACLIPINFFTGFGVPWSLYILTSWGIVRGVAAWRVFFQRQGYSYDRAFQKWDERQKA